MFEINIPVLFATGFLMASYHTVALAFLVLHWVLEIHYGLTH